MQPTSHKQRFICTLDAYRDLREFQYVDLLNVVNLSKMHYGANHLHGLHDTKKIDQDDALLTVKMMRDVKHSPSTGFYQDLHQSTWNSSNTSNPFAQNGILKPSIFYQGNQIKPIPDGFRPLFTPLCNSNASLPFGGIVPLPLPKVEKIHKKNIDISIKHFSDILTILDQHEYREDTEYNIDLKSLVQIKDELHELDRMVGITKFKDAVLDQILYFVQNLHHGKDPDFMHTVLAGPPGTGKTEIAKILGKMYSKIGILKQGVFKKVCRSDLIAGYLGQTAIKTKKVITETLGGCLFIDEAYSLACGEAGNHDSYSKECLDTLCECLSDHKGDLMVIIAGYEEELANTFFKMNRGLESRFIWRFVLEEYTAKELADIFTKKVQENEWTFVSGQENDNRTELYKWFQKRREEFRHFGRDMELLFTYSKIAHGRRIYGKSAELRKQLTLSDVDTGYKTFLANTKKKAESEIMGLYV